MHEDNQVPTCPVTVVPRQFWHNVPRPSIQAEDTLQGLQEREGDCLTAWSARSGTSAWAGSSIKLLVGSGPGTALRWCQPSAVTFSALQWSHPKATLLTLVHFLKRKTQFTSAAAQYWRLSLVLRLYNYTDFHQDTLDYSITQEGWQSTIPSEMLSGHLIKIINFVFIKSKPFSDYCYSCNIKNSFHCSLAATVNSITPHTVPAQHRVSMHLHLKIPFRSSASPKRSARGSCCSMEESAEEG